MNGAVIGDRVLADLLPESSHLIGTAGMEFCDKLVAQCLDAIPLKITVTNAAGVIAFYNRAVYQYYGPRIAWSKLPHERDHLFYHGDAAIKRAAREKALRTGLSVDAELRTIGCNYVPVWHRFRLTPLFNKASLVTGLLITMTEIDGPPAAA